MCPSGLHLVAASDRTQPRILVKVGEFYRRAYSSMLLELISLDIDVDVAFDRLPRVARSIMSSVKLIAAPDVCHRDTDHLPQAPAEGRVGESSKALWLGMLFFVHTRSIRAFFLFL